MLLCSPGCGHPKRPVPWQGPSPADVHPAAGMKTGTLCGRYGGKLQLVPLKRSILPLRKLLCHRPDRRVMQKRALSPSPAEEAMAHGHAAPTLLCLLVDVVAPR